MYTTYQRCACPHCQQDLEYPSELSEQVIDCPMCAAPMTLPAKIPVSPPRTFLQRLKDTGQSVLDKRKLKALLLESVDDGVLTGDEIAKIEALMVQSRIGREALEPWANEIVGRAVDSINRENVSLGRLQSVDAVREFLGVPTTHFPEQFQRLGRWRYIASIREGTIPIQESQNIVLAKGETVHWVEPAQLWEERVVSKRYQGGSAGVSFRIAKGITIRTGGTRGQLVTDTADVPIAEGNFVITNRRLIFQGDAKSFATKYEKILDMDNHLDGIRYSESNRQKPRKIQYHSSNGDIIIEILSQLFSRATTGI